MRHAAADSRNWVALAVLSLVVGLIGPFGTFEVPLPPRLAYWTAVVFGTAIAGTFFASLGERLLGDRLPRLIGAAVAGAVAGLPITLLVILINAAARAGTASRPAEPPAP